METYTLNQIPENTDTRMRKNGNGKINGNGKVNGNGSVIFDPAQFGQVRDFSLGDLDRSTQQGFEYTCVADTASYYRLPEEREGRPRPLVVNSDLMIRAYLLAKKDFKFLSSSAYDQHNKNDSYKVGSSVATFNERSLYLSNFVESLTIIDPSLEGLERSVSFLGLPNSGPEFIYFDEKPKK
ncbi:Uncharacterised protein [uncultured archaeon]|nr:Uncharacterised protein [uncultured archaeon]